jgi:transposase-like protein
VEGLIGAGRLRRTGERLNWRNGVRDRTRDTRLGALQLRIPKLRQGSSFPPFLEPRGDLRDSPGGGDPGSLDRRGLDAARRRPGAGDGPDGDLDVHGLQALKDIDERVGAFLDRALAGEWPSLWRDAT